MNLKLQHIITASLVTLALAAAGCLWLVWQSFSESQELERQNRELRASLEASRIRVENFCDYPTDALCRVDERTGNVAGAMDPLPGIMPPVPNTPLENAPEALLSGLAPAAPAEEKVLPSADKSADAKDAAQALGNAPAADKKPLAQAEPLIVPALELAKVRNTAVLAEKPAEKVEIKTEKPAESVKPVPSPMPDPGKPELKIEEKPALVPPTEKPAEKAEPLPAPVPAVEAAKAEPVALQEAEKPISEPEKNEEAPVSELAPSAAQSHEVSGKFTALPPAGLEKNTPEKAKAPARPQEVKAKKKESAPAEKPQAAAGEIRKSWSRVEHDGEIFAFTITGSGPELPAQGRLLDAPWCYELTLDGLWDVKKHSGVENRLVKKMTTAVRNGKKTVITFHLKQKPYRSSLHRTDPRTVSVRIR